MLQSLGMRKIQASGKGSIMMTQEQTATVKNYIEVFLAALLIVFGLSALAWSKSNHFTNLGAVAFCIAGLLIIIKANYEYKKRRSQDPLK